MRYNKIQQAADTVWYIAHSRDINKERKKGTSHEHEERSVSQLMYGFNTNPITGGPETSINRVQAVEDVTTVTERTSKYCMN